MDLVIENKDLRSLLERETKKNCDMKDKLR